MNDQAATQPRTKSKRRLLKFIALIAVLLVGVIADDENGNVTILAKSDYGLASIRSSFMRERI